MAQIDCPKCMGRGTIYYAHDQEYEKCSACDGSGKTDDVQDEVTQLNARMAELERQMNVLIDALREHNDYRPMMWQVLREVSR